MWDVTFYRHLVNDQGRLGKVALDQIAIERARNAAEAQALGIAWFERKHGVHCWDQLAHELSLAQVDPPALGSDKHHEAARV